MSENITRVCLIPMKIEIRRPALNVVHLEQRLAEVSVHHPDLVCFPECTLTGYLAEEEDFARFAEPIPGPTTQRVAQLAKQYGFYLCVGLLESSPDGVYNSAVLFDPAGQMILKHRKNAEKPPFVNGDVVESVETELGRLGILICGDMFDEQVVRKLSPAPDLLLMPMARCFDDFSPNPARWESEGRQEYLDAVKAAGVTTLIVNELEVGSGDYLSFGGALIVDAGGKLLAESPHGTDGALVYDYV